MFNHWLVCAHLDDLLEGVQVLLHAVVQPQVGDEVTGEHSIQAVEQRVHTCMEVHHEDHGHVTCMNQSQQHTDQSEITEVFLYLNTFPME